MDSSSKNKRKAALDAKKKMQNMSRDQLRAAIEKKKECNARAMSIVERLIEPQVDAPWMLENLTHINQCHLQDAVEERAISKICGYPLCDSILGSVPIKQFHISTRHNKVFDITDRKNYCSNVCYKAGVFLKDQLLTSPLWLRDCEKPVTYKLFSSAPISGIGQEVDLGITNPVKPENDLELDSNGSEDIKNKKNIKKSKPVDEVLCESDSEGEDFQDAREEVDDISDRLKTVSMDCKENHIENVDEEFHLPPMSFDDIECHRSDHSGPYCEREADSLKKKSDQPVPIQETPEQKRNDKRKTDYKVDSNESNMKKMKTSLPLGVKIESFVMEWFTVDSLSFIYGEEAVKEKFQEFGSPVNEIKFNKIKDSYMFERYEEICRKLNILEIKDREEKFQPSKPLPDYDQLKKEAKELELKVKSFFKGDAKVSFKTEVEEKNEDESDERPLILPLVDRHAIRATRRRIMLDKLNKTLPDILSALNLSQFSVRNEIKELVYTLSLSATNIVMKPHEWNLVAIILIRIMINRNECLKQAYQSELTQKRLVNLLMTYNLDVNYLERQVLNINDIERIIRNSQ